MRTSHASLAMAALLALIGAMLWLDLHRSEREAWPADVRAAYTVGIVTGLNASDLEDIDAGRPVRPVFRPPGQRGGSVIVWKKSWLARPGACLGDQAGRVPEPPCRKQDRFRHSPDRLVFARTAGGGLIVGVHAKPLEAGETQALGAVYGARGEIRIGRSLQQAARFPLDIEGPFRWDVTGSAAPAPEAEFEPGKGHCRPAREVRPATPLLAAWSVRFRSCTLEGKDGRRLVLLQHRHGPVQRWRRLAVAQCRGLLQAAIPAADPPDYAGCLAANWGDRATPQASLVLFQSLGRGTWSSIRPSFPTREPPRR